MIHTDKDTKDITITCDEPDCDETFYGDNDLMYSLASAKEQGWRNVKGELGWSNYGPICAAKKGL